MASPSKIPRRSLGTSSIHSPTTTTSSTSTHDRQQQRETSEYQTHSNLVSPLVTPSRAAQPHYHSEHRGIEPRSPASGPSRSSPRPSLPSSSTRIKSPSPESKAPRRYSHQHRSSTSSSTHSLSLSLPPPPPHATRSIHQIRERETSPALSYESFNFAAPQTPGDMEDQRPLWSRWLPLTSSTEPHKEEGRMNTRDLERQPLLGQQVKEDGLPKLSRECFIAEVKCYGRYMLPPILLFVVLALFIALSVYNHARHP